MRSRAEPARGTSRARRLGELARKWWSAAALLIYYVYSGRMVEGLRWYIPAGALAAISFFLSWVNLSIIRANRASDHDARQQWRVVVAGLAIVVLLTALLFLVREQMGTLAYAISVPVLLTAVLALWRLHRRRHFGPRFRMFGTWPYRLFRAALNNRLGMWLVWILLFVSVRVVWLGVVAALQISSAKTADSVFMLLLLGVFVAIGYVVYVGDVAHAQQRQRPGSDDRRPVILLRSFDQDLDDFTHLPRSAETSGLLRSGVNVDTFLAPAIGRDLGPLQALGNPADVFPEPGAERTYVHDETWQREVIQLVERAQAIIASAAVSDGITWELQWIRAAGHHRKLFLVFPPGSTVVPWRSLVLRYCEWLASRVFRMSGRPSTPAVPWTCIVQHLQSLGYRMDDHPPPPGSVIGFDPDARPIRVTTGAVTADDYSTAVALHLRRVAG